MATLQLKTGGMHCPSCSMLIELTVSELAGVTAVSADYVKGTARIEFDPSAIPQADIIAAIQDAGYTVEVAA